MKRSKILIILFVLAATIFCAIYLVINRGAFIRITGKKSNVLLIVSDAMRKDVLGCYGGEARTPNIDWLAKNGATFTGAYTTAPCTIPSSITMFTGNYAKSYIMVLDKLEHEWIKYIYRVPSAQVLFAELFREQGIDVRMSIENELAVRTNNDQGFIPLLEKNNLNKQSIRHIENETGISGEADQRYENDYGLFHYFLNVPRNKRFFIVKWFMDPHPPYNPPDRFKTTLYVDLDKLPRNLSFYFRVMNLNEIEWSESEADFLKKLYMCEVESIDERLGTILEFMRTKNLLENTYIILTSDHGESLGEPGKGWKHQHRFWQDIVNVPLIFYGPDIKGGLVIENKVSHVDLMPTICELLQIRYENEAFGKSYTPLLYGKNMAPRDIFMDSSSQALTSENFDDCALIGGDYKYWRHYKGNKLFNINIDPQERNNLVDSHPEVANRLHDKMTSLLNEIEGIRNRNIGDIYEKFDVEEHTKETLEKLKSLGYIK
jgi:choline-sulfatase